MLSDAAPPTLSPIVTTGAAKPEGQTVAEYGIVSAYQRVLADDPDVTMPVAAIEALISVLGQTTSSTVMETLDIIRTEAERLKASVPNPVPLAAGTDLFQQYLLRSLKKQDGSSSRRAAAAAAAAQSAAATTATDSFEETRQYLIRNSRLFASRAKQARAAIADRGARIITEGKVVLTGGGSRTVAAILLRAAELHTAEHGSPRFRVVYVVDPRFSSPPPATAPSSSAQQSQSQEQQHRQQQQQQQHPSVAAALRARGIPVAEVAEREVAHVLRTAGVDFAVLGAEVLCQNGGILSRIGTFNIAELVRAYGKSVYVAAESHKIARVYPLSQMDLPRCGVQQQVVRFTTGADADAPAPEPPKPADDDPVDYTPPQMITKFITEYGTKTPSDIYEMLLDIYS
ncbi:translation initiation factor eIF-2B subunit alpha [Magnaporthiopsis poae ATCC 64411]|uniref:Translation initiation factor eIF2B subunit alpha n=1 Tax=Magnaporthiopsis poae (strain ATCC 64411 / 73-15) TaxID=644358 RepID=A0A0C4DLA7_MAGP6|nr:translation initiation factor eIF-2B subunit alpha [Magnaporthiopsis poae ATCC 64411]